jgi:molecular chaperone DnaJ
MASKDYYLILGLSSNASNDEIKRAYRRLAMQFHPDRNRGKEEWANDRIKEINEAFSVLGDPKMREQYDHFGTVGSIGDIPGSQATRTVFEDLMNDFGGVGLGSDFLDDILGDSFDGRGFAFRPSRRVFGRGGSTRFETQGGISLEDLFEQVESPEDPPAHP